MTGRSKFPRAAQNVPEGTQLNNMFEIDELVSAGGMGEVYRGHNIQTQDPVAIKIVLPEFAQDEMILELFRKEARILNHLHHEAIVRYYVFSIDAALGLPFLAMEFVDGPSLAERIKAGPLDAASVVTLQQNLADGLEKAHQAGVIHRDIAPDNIILPDGRVDRAKIIDFGIARSAAAGGTLLGGQFAGKYNFVSPEQLGLFDGEVTNRSDIYSLGLVLAACALGRPLDMSGSQVAVIEKRRTVPDLTGIDPPMRELITAMLQPDPEDRPQSMAEVADWPTFEESDADFEKTRLYTTPPTRQRAATRHPSRAPTRHPSRGPTRHPSRAPTAHPPNPPPDAAPEKTRPPTWHPSQPPAEPAPEPSQPPASWHPSHPPAATPPEPAPEPSQPPASWHPSHPPAAAPPEPAPQPSQPPASWHPSHPPAATPPEPAPEPSQPPASWHPSHPPAAAPPEPAPQPSQPPASWHPSHPPAAATPEPAPQPSQPPASWHPSHPPAAAPQHTSLPPAAPPSQPPQAAAPDVSRPTSHPPAASRARPAERRRDKPKSRAGRVAVAIAVTSLLVGGVGGWAYVEYWSGTWYEAGERLIAPVAEAELPPADEEIIATPEPPEVLFTAADIREYVTSYDGGSCFFAFPVSVGDKSAEVIGYGNQRRAFDAMRNAFQARFGFDAAIEMRNVTDDQCVMVDALGRLAGQAASPMALDLSHGVVRSGSSLSGTISGLGERHLALVMLDNFGFVHNLQSYVTEEDGGASFAIEEMSTANPMDFQPQLILSVASAEPLEAFDLQQSLPASEFLPTLLDEIDDQPDGLASAVGYFMFGS